jgi:thiamine biosynthesis protein ThiS
MHAGERDVDHGPSGGDDAATDAATLRLVVNGAPQRLARGATIADLLAQLGVKPALLAVERNGALVPKSRHAETRLADGDAIEIVTFVGGG